MLNFELVRRGEGTGNYSVFPKLGKSKEIISKPIGN